MIDQKDVTIIIPHYGSDEQQEYAIEQCVFSLNETVPDMKKIIVKNGMQCKGQHMIPNCSIINLSEQGQCKAVNAAVATTNTPWIFITNDDMVYAPGWFDRLTMNDALAFKALQCLSPKLVEPRQGAPTFIVKFFGGAGGDFDKEGWLRYAKDYSFGDLPNARDFIQGFNLPLLIHRDLWNIVGGYDINYDPWGSNSDSDLEYKIKLSGVQPLQNQDCIVYHFSQTSGTFNPANNEYYQRNFAYFKNKWGFDRTDDGIWEASFKIPTKEEGRIFCPSWEAKYG